MSYNYDPSKGGIKNDQGKLRLELVPPEAILAIGAILTHGASKYEDRNWEKGMPLERVYGAAQRHLQQWAQGVEVDPDSGLPHLEHALCNLAMMVALRRRAFIATGVPPREVQRQEQGIVAHRDYTEAEIDNIRHPREDLMEEFRSWLQDNDGVPS